MRRLAANAAALRAGLGREGFDLGGSCTHIVPLIVGDAELASRLSEAALARGVFAQAIRPPTVPAMTARLRLAVMATHREEELIQAARTLGSVARSLGIPPRHASEPVLAPVSAEAETAVAAEERADAAGGGPRGVRLRGARAGPARRLTLLFVRGLVSAELRGCFVTGTDTGVGKTVVAAAIVAALRRRGAQVRAVKPIITGLDDPPDPDWPPDHELLARAAGAHAADVILAGYGPAGVPASGRRAGRRTAADAAVAGRRGARRCSRWRGHGR